jgi:coenzyme Q-binding protein COQ10
MPILTQLRTLPYPAEKIYQLVMDIEKYPEFLPWCKQARIVEVISEKNLHADLLINFKSFFEKYRSNVTHGKSGSDAYFVDVVATEGPFKKLINQWQFRDLEGGKCEVKFFIDFEFNSLLLGKIISPIFEKASEKMMAAFEERARNLF